MLLPSLLTPATDYSDVICYFDDESCDDDDSCCFSPTRYADAALPRYADDAYRLLVDAP